MAYPPMNIQLPGGIRVPMSVVGLQERAPASVNGCDQGHDMTAVKQSTACPVCNNADRDTWKKCVRVGKELKELPKVEEEEVVADHSISQLTAHNHEEVAALTLSAGKVYGLQPKTKADELMYANIKKFMLANPKIALCTSWGPTTKKSYTWILDIQMDILIIREMLHPNDVKAVAAPTAEGNDAMVGMLGMLLQPEKFDQTTYADHNAAAKEAAKAARGSNSAPVMDEAALMAQMQAALAGMAPKKTTRKKAA